MAIVHRVTAYRVNGEEFATLDDLVESVERRLGAGIDQATVGLTPRQRLDIYKYLVNNKERFLSLLETLADVDLLRRSSRRGRRPPGGRRQRGALL